VRKVVVKHYVVNQRNRYTTAMVPAFRNECGLAAGGRCVQ